MTNVFLYFLDPLIASAQFEVLTNHGNNAQGHCKFSFSDLSYGQFEASVVIWLDFPVVSYTVSIL